MSTETIGRPIRPISAGHGRRRRWLLISGLALLAVAGVLAGILATHWPFTRAAILRDIEQGTHGKVEIKSFRGTYFPWPGCIAEGVTVQAREHNGSELSLAAQKLTVKGSYTGMFSSPKRISQIVLEGLRVKIGHGTTGENPQQANEQPKKNHVLIGEIRADGTDVEVVSKDPEKQPWVFSFHEVRIHSFSLDRTASFQIAFDNPKPPALVQVNGQVGPLKAGAIGEVPLSGSYTLVKGNLGAVSGVGGELSSNGQFKGVLGRVAVQGNADIRDFEIKKVHHPVSFTSRFQGLVNGLNGDVAVQSVEARILNTTVVGEGSIAGKPGKTVALDLRSKEARIEDLMFFFGKRPQSQIMGPIVFHARALLPPEKRRFIEKIQLEGDFDIPTAHFIPKTQAKVNKLSERARGDTKDEDIQQVTARLQGHVVLKDGIARFSNSFFTVPGATAKLQGTYSVLQDHKVDMLGSLRMEAKLSQATKGVKSFFARFLNPFYEKKNAGADVPVAITGTNKHPKFQVKLTGKRSKS